MTELSRRKLDSKRTPTPFTKATGKGRRDIDDALDQHDMRAIQGSRWVGASSTGASSIQFVAFVVNPGETRVINYRTAVELTGKSVPCTVERYGSHILDCSAAEQSRIALAYRESESRGIVRRLLEAALSWRVRGGAAMDQTVVEAGSTARVHGWIIKSRDDAKANLPDLGTDRNGSRGEDNL